MKKISWLICLLVTCICLPQISYGQNEFLTPVKKAILLGRYHEQMPRLLVDVLISGDMAGAEQVLSAWGKPNEGNFAIAVLRIHNDFVFRELNKLVLADSEIDKQYQQADDATRLLCRAVEEGPYVRVAKLLIASLGANPYIRQENGDLTLVEMAKAKYGENSAIVKVLENTTLWDYNTAEKIFLRYR